MSEDRTFGTADPDAPVTRADFERALRHVNMSYADMRDLLMRLAGQVVALTDELVRRVDRVEPTPAPPGTPARETAGTIEESVRKALDDTVTKLQMADVKAGTGRVWLDSDPGNKYDEQGPDIPCAELLSLCGARCCQMGFALSTADLDEGVIRWDYGRPYMIRQRASDGFCVHNDPATHGCSVHGQRPLVCRRYDCRDDKRVWIDYEKRIPAPRGVAGDPESALDLRERLNRKMHAVMVEMHAVDDAYPDAEPRRGPAPAPGTTMYKPR